MNRNIIALLQLATLAFCPAPTLALNPVQDTFELAGSLCMHPGLVPPQLADHELTEKDIIVRGSRLGTEKLFTSETNTVKLDIIEPAGRPKRTAFTVADGTDINQPGIWMIFNSDCELLQAKHAIHNEDNTPLYIETLDQSLNATAERDWLNPPLPDKGRQTGLRVALIDSGVNYQLDEIARSLALDEHGDLIGYDYWDNDTTPFDANPARSWFFVQRHGTRTASILLNEAPDIALVPYRYPRPDMSRMALLVEHAASNSVRIIGMPLGSDNQNEWAHFSTAAEQHPEILFIVSAGNNGRDIDIQPVYPAALEHTNILVVTSADDTIRPAEHTNYGALSVDYLLPAENIHALDFSGEQTLVSGSSYAVARLTALAARILNKQPGMSIAELKQQISEFSIGAATGSYVSTGYIGDPVADTAELSSHKDPAFQPVVSESRYLAPLNLIVLTNDWTTDRIADALKEVNDIFDQCGFAINAEELLRVNGASYISNLSPGSALTLQRYLKDQINTDATTVYFAADTDMQTKFDAEAFGEANTGSRPWMRNSLWVTSVTPDTGNAVAHELFHILANNGRHSRETNNLMQNRTSPKNIRLSVAQCQEVITNATLSGLIK